MTRRTCSRARSRISKPRPAGVDLWVNARVDTYLRRLVPVEQAYDETVSRARLYREAGANSIFVPAASDAATIEKLVKAVVLPLNLLAWPGLPDAATLESLGVRRLSAGSGIGKVVLNHTFELAKSFLATGRSELFAEGALGNPQINGLMRKD
jgi:2-methylisocitrate lyase-like PEP mutase family enzyme